MHNGYCAKWKCETTSSATAGSCKVKYTHTYAGPSWARLDEGGCVEAISQGLTPGLIDLFCVACAANQIEINGRNEKHCVLGEYSADRSSVSILYKGLKSVPFSWQSLPIVVNLFPDDPIIVIGEASTSSTDCDTVADTKKTFFFHKQSTVCQVNTSCNNLSQSQCSKNTTCSREAGSSTSSSLKCYRQGTTAAVADSGCATLTQPQC